jgi:hypothetical protein
MFVLETWVITDASNEFQVCGVKSLIKLQNIVLLFYVKHT